MVSYSASCHPSFVMLMLLLTVISNTLGSSSSFVFVSKNMMHHGPVKNQQLHPASSRITTRFLSLHMSTVIKPPETTEKTRRRSNDDSLGIPYSDDEDVRGPIEYLIDDPLTSREYDDPFHILLLDSTFTQNARITIPYVASSCAYVLSMPYDEAAELAAFAEKEGFSCLGTWSHEECVRLGRQLQNRDVICRVVPFCEGGDRAWQARNAKEEDQIVGEGGRGDNARWA